MLLFYISVLQHLQGESKPREGSSGFTHKPTEKKGQRHVAHLLNDFHPHYFTFNQLSFRYIGVFDTELCKSLKPALIPLYIAWTMGNRCYGNAAN